MEKIPQDIRPAANALLAMQRQSWEQGVAMQAFLEWGESEMVIQMAYEAVNQDLPDGRVAMVGAPNGITDPCATGEALLFACRETGDATLQAGYDALLSWALEKAPRNAEGVLYHLTDSRQFWVDSFYMLPPFLAAAGHYREALLNLYGYWRYLFDADKQLMAHKWDDGAKAFLRRDHWGVGNGWALAALARMYDALPENYAEDRHRIGEMGRTLIEGILPYLRDDYLFHDIVDDPQTFVETNLSQQLAYTLYRGVASGWLPPHYLETAHALRRATEDKVDAHGFVRDVCGAPHFDRPGIAAEGQAFFLLMQHAAQARTPQV